MRRYHQNRCAFSYPIHESPIITGPDRCQLSRLDTPAPRTANSSEKSFTLEFTNSIPISKDLSSAVDDVEEFRFLDLPRELRDMVYTYVCDDMKRTGELWHRTAQPPPPTDPEDLGASDTDREFEYYDQREECHDCSIMATCKQVHWEFAEMLYARPIQFASFAHSLHTIPMSAPYARLVQKLLAVHDMQSSYMPYGQGFEFESAADAWRHTIQIASRLSKLFPHLRTLRLVIQSDFDIDETWVALCGEDKIAQDEQVKMAEDFLRTTRWKNGRKIKIPAQLELVHAASLKPIIHEVTPLIEALKNVREAEAK